MPVAALAGILIVVGVRMIDRHSFSFLKSRSTILDFGVIAAVVATALTVSLIAASGVGIVLAVMLFVREQISGSVVRRKVLGNQIFSKRVRTQEEMEILSRHGDRAAIIELQGSLFFGTADQLYTQHGTGTEDARFPDSRHAPHPDRGCHGGAPAGAGQGHAGRAQWLSDLQPDPAQPAFGPRLAAAISTRSG